VLGLNATPDGKRPTTRLKWYSGVPPRAVIAWLKATPTLAGASGAVLLVDECDSDCQRQLPQWAKKRSIVNTREPSSTGFPSMFQTLARFVMVAPYRGL